MTDGIYVQGIDENLQHLYDEQVILIAVLPDHWKPYSEFAFASGVSQGEQRAIKPENIDWLNETLSINSLCLDVRSHIPAADSSLMMQNGCITGVALQSMTQTEEESNSPVPLSL